MASLVDGVTKTVSCTRRQSIPVAEWVDRRSTRRRRNFKIGARRDGRLLVTGHPRGASMFSLPFRTRVSRALRPTAALALKSGFFANSAIGVRPRPETGSRAWWKLNGISTREFSLPVLFAWGITTARELKSPPRSMARDDSTSMTNGKVTALITRPNEDYGLIRCPERKRCRVFLRAFSTGEL